MGETRESRPLWAERFATRAELLDVQQHVLRGVERRLGPTWIGVALVFAVLFDLIGAALLSQGLQPRGYAGSGTTHVVQGVVMMACCLAAAVLIHLRTGSPYDVYRAVYDVDRTPASRRLPPGEIRPEQLTVYDCRTSPELLVQTIRRTRTSNEIVPTAGLAGLTTVLGIATVVLLLLLIPTRVLTTSVVSALVGVALCAHTTWVAFGVVRVFNVARHRDRTLEAVLVGVSSDALRGIGGTGPLGQGAWRNSTYLDVFGPSARELRQPRARSGMVPDPGAPARVTETGDRAVLTFTEDELLIEAVTGHALPVRVRRSEVVAVRRWVAAPWMPDAIVLAHPDEPLALYGTGVAERAEAWFAAPGVTGPGTRSTC